MSYPIFNELQLCLLFINNILDFEDTQGSMPCSHRKNVHCPVTDVSMFISLRYNVKQCSICHKCYYTNMPIHLKPNLFRFLY